MRLAETAYAKINLALHVRGRLADGYHEIETLFAFVDQGDRLTARDSMRDEVRAIGEFASQITDPFGNLVSKALAVLPRSQGLAVTLEKNLPVAAGLGGGSADAGAIFRMVRSAFALPDDWRERAARLGADVPACVESTTCIGRGTGTMLDPVESDLVGCPVLLVNPRIPLATGSVFAGWDGKDRGPLPAGPVSAIAREGRNDLQPAATAMAPEISQVVEAISRQGAHCSRMSGSGATCFGLFEDNAQLAQAAQVLASQHPSWWIMQGHLR